MCIISDTRIFRAWSFLTEAQESLIGYFFSWPLSLGLEIYDPVRDIDLIDRLPEEDRKNIKYLHSQGITGPKWDRGVI